MTRRAALLHCILPIVCAACMLQSAGAQSDAEPRPFRIVGYLPDYRAAEFDPSVMSRLTDLMIFSAEPSVSEGLNLKRVADFPWEKILSMKSRHRTRVILTVGGWERSHAFTEVSRTEGNRSRFATACVEVCLRKRLDGIDLDWEHPENAEQARCYSLLLAALKKEMKPHGLTLSVTLAAWQQLDPAAFESVDWVHVMAYDHPKQHSTYENAKIDTEKLIKSGASAAKITLGIPFYGRKVDQPDNVRTYRQILESTKRRTMESDEWNGYYFNGPATVKRKVQYAMNEGLAGVMIWELAQDAQGDGSLLNVINETAHASALDNGRRQ